MLTPALVPRKLFKLILLAVLVSFIVYGILFAGKRPSVSQIVTSLTSSDTKLRYFAPVPSAGDNATFVYDPFADVEGGEKLPPGKPFAFSASYLSSIGFPLPDRLFATEPVPSSLPNDKFVVVTAASGYFLFVVMDAIALIQRNLPKQRIIFYDLGGIDESNVLKIRKLCDVEYRKFNFSRYPPHVAELKTYAWKPIAIHDALQTYNAVLWIDSSMRLRTNNITKSFLKAQESGGIALFDFSGHSVFAATHEGLYKYLPIDKHTAGMAGMFGANGILLYRKRQMYDSVVRWWFLCALTEACIASSRQLGCNFAHDPLRHWKHGNCHRFDQSALGVLLANNITRWRRGQARLQSGSMTSSLNKTVVDPSVDGGPDQLHLGGVVVSPDVGTNLMATERGAVDREKIYVCGEKRRSEMTDADLRKPREYLTAN